MSVSVKENLIKKISKYNLFLVNTKDLEMVSALKLCLIRDVFRYIRHYHVGLFAKIVKSSMINV